MESQGDQCPTQSAGASSAALFPVLPLLPTCPAPHKEAQPSLASWLLGRGLTPLGWIPPAVSVLLLSPAS